jgi:hypothetical protein
MADEKPTIPRWVKIAGPVAGTIAACLMAWHGYVAEPATAMLDIQTRTLATKQHEAMEKQHRSEIMESLRRIEKAVTKGQK